MDQTLMVIDFFANSCPIKRKFLVWQYILVSIQLNRQYKNVDQSIKNCAQMKGFSTYMLHLNDEILLPLHFQTT